MKHCTALFLACALSGLTATADTLAAVATSSALRPYQASYAFLWRGINAGTSNFALQQQSTGEWLYVSRNQPRGLFKWVPSAAMTLTSRISVDANGVRPLLFTAHENDETALQAEVHFDWASNRATGAVEGERVDMALRTGVQDDLSVQIAFIYALANGQSVQDISVFDKQGIRDYAYTRVGEETLHTPVGDIATVVYRSQRAHSPRSTRFWCAPQYGFIPMRAEQRRDDQVEWTMKLRSIHRD